MQKSRPGFWKEPQGAAYSSEIQLVFDVVDR